MTGAMDGHQAQHTKPLGFGQQQQRAANNTYSLKPTAYLTLMAAGEAANGSDGQAAAELPAFCSSLPDSVTALLRLVDGVWAESGQISARSSSSSSSSSSSAKPETSAPAINVPPPGLEGASNPPEKFVRRVSRQRLLLPEQQQRLQSVPQNYHSTLRDKLHTTSPKRSVTIADPEEPDWPQVPQPARSPYGLTRSFTLEAPVQSMEYSAQQDLHLQHMAQQLQQLQQLQQMQMQQEYEQQQLLQYQQMQMLRQQKFHTTGHSGNFLQPERPVEEPRSRQTSKQKSPQNQSRGFTEPVSKPSKQRAAAALAASAASAASAAPAAATAAAAAATAPTQRPVRKTMKEIVAEVTTPTDTEAEFEMEEKDEEIIVGPTIHAVQPLTFEDLWIESSVPGEKCPVRSRSSVLSVSDVLRLRHTPSETPEPVQVRSFGSLVHSCETRAPCRPCMFERVPGRCKKSWLCDFCHLHSGRKKKGSEATFATGA
eukprot:s929_g11.t1